MTEVTPMTEVTFTNDTPPGKIALDLNQLLAGLDPVNVDMIISFLVGKHLVRTAIRMQDSLAVIEAKFFAKIISMNDFDFTVSERTGSTKLKP